jgi:mRNA-degrading endonuclease RelE of RelBE toxin-antitoxin system
VPYRVEFSPEAEDHLRALTRRQQSIVLAAVEQQLVHQPTVATRNRKALHPNPIAPWELRVGDLRVYFLVEEDEQVVKIRAIGIKDRNRVRIMNQVVDLS